MIFIYHNISLKYLSLQETIKLSNDVQHPPCFARPFLVTSLDSFTTPNLSLREDYTSQIRSFSIITNDTLKSQWNIIPLSGLQMKRSKMEIKSEEWKYFLPAKNRNSTDWHMSFVAIFVPHLSKKCKTAFFLNILFHFSWMMKLVTTTTTQSNFLNMVIRETNEWHNLNENQ